MRFKQFLLEYDTSRIDSFLTAIKKESTPDPSGTKNSFWHKGVFFIIRPQRHSQKVHLEEIKSPRGNGAGTKAQTWFIGLADKHRIPISLHPTQLQKDGPSKEKLIQWYEKHGFTIDPGSAVMLREPKKHIKESTLWPERLVALEDIIVHHPPGQDVVKSLVEAGDHVFINRDRQRGMLTSGYVFIFSPDIADKFGTEREYHEKWLKSLGDPDSDLHEAKHPLDLQIAKEMAMDHITEKGYIPWNAELWHDDSDVHDDEGNPYSYGEYYYGDNIDAFAQDSKSAYRNYKIMDVHVPEDKPMFFNPKTEEFLIPVGFLFVDEEKIMKHGDHGMSTLDRNSNGRYGHNDDEHEMNVVTYIKVNLNSDKTDQVLDINDEIPQWNRTPEYKKLKRLANMHDDKDFVKDRFDKLEKKFKGQATQWVKITDQDKLDEAAHPLDFQIACETAREFVIDQGHQIDPEDAEFYQSQHIGVDDWEMSDVHVDIMRRHQISKYQEEQPAYYNDKLEAYIIPVTYDYKPKDPTESRGWFSHETTVWVMVTRSETKFVDRRMYINNNAIHDMIDDDDPKFNAIKKRLGAWREIYGDD